MRILARIARAALVVVAVLAAPAPFAADTALELRQFAQTVGVTDVDGFVETVAALRASGRLPPRYVSKRHARELGWRPGVDLCRLARGDSLGGDRFNDRGHALPSAAGRRWREADLDERCAVGRGTHRLLWSSDGLIYVTTDHYRTFVPVPAAPR